jgi:hypothetical protein
MPEYGRHVQKMIEYVKDIPQKDKRNQQINSVVGVMGVLNPQLRDLSDFKHKLWDHVQIIADFDIDIDSPYPTPTRETFSTAPNPIPLDKSPLKAVHYGRNIQNMLKMISEKPEGEEKDAMIIVLANYMRQQYLIWNKDSVTEEIIFRDIVSLSDGKIKIPDNFHLSPISAVNHTHSHTSNQSKSHFRQNKRKPNKQNKRK